MKTQKSNKKVWGKPEVKILSVKENTKGGAMVSTAENGGMMVGS